MLTQFTPMKRICETIRINAQMTHNSTPGRKRGQMIRDPKKVVQFGWERPKLQTIEEMKSVIMGLNHVKGIQVTQKGKKVEGI